ncbi:hypothetical protein L6452_31192 [Arctium lappa]|uniref:Uncharacterized protein n=1 Tax=Arctium lappa TaxID=4217 RepID=A0ACB8ZPL7_ARCLA|nr:hypothetical protein L6452_31192 [Arctium lappa]
MVILSGKPLLFFSYTFIYLINGFIKAQPEYLYYFCRNDSTYTPNSRYARNLYTTISSLPNTNTGYGFYNFSVAQGPDTANAISLCRGDVEPGMCRSCLNDSVVQLRQVCPNQREAIVYYDNCLLRYSNATILGNNDMDKDVVYMWNNNNASNKAQFNADLRLLMNQLRSKAAAGGSLLKFATANTSGPDFSTIYGLAQCVPFLSEQQWNTCLESAINQIPSCCDGKLGGRVLTANCNFRFEIYQFANTTSVLPPPPSPPSPPPSPPPVLPTPGDPNFGMARLFNPDETHGSTNRIVGTYGYMSPEYAMHGQFSIKSDVFSFGVLVLEIITGQKNTCFRIGKGVEDLLSYAWKSWRDGNISDMIDPALMVGPGSLHEIMRSIHIGLLCVQNNVVDRPTMGSVVLMLNSFSLTLQLPSVPAFFMHSGVEPEMPLEGYISTSGTSGSGTIKRRSSSSQVSINDASISEIIPR